MEPISTALAGIALVKSAVDGIKSAINTANDVGDIAHYIDDLFRGEQEAQKARAKKSKFGFADQMGVTTVAQEIIDGKLAAERLQEIGTMIDLRFGPGTFASIKAERQKRIEEAKQIEKEEQKQRALEKKQQREEIKIFGLTFLVVFVLLLILFGILWITS